ncbi:hypothetical protein [Lutibacter citreus]|uniref:hypothetical protein n=1 Tax=Lutibacter citreus TaxID=2138210 RepID=UPI000DBE7C86|nr:hypothetical protein [Lutibacter citreus]
MKAIGGYFELELNKGEEYHKKAISLNTGRNALEYILLANGYKKIYLPFFTCDVLLEPIQKLKIEVVFYNINELLEPVFDFNSIKHNEAFLYTNYFGLKDSYINVLAKSCKNLIIDNAQSFYSKPIKGVDTFYSPRKFFGVPDGAYLYSNKNLDIDLEKDVSYNRFEHLLRRIDTSAEDGYSYFKENDEKLSKQPIKKMAKLTQLILSNIDYRSCANKRRQNFNYLHDILNKTNLLEVVVQGESVPMVYPYWCEDIGLRERLINNKVYTATYWPNILEWCTKDDLEFKLASDIVYLPIDQRQTEKELVEIIKIIKNEY